MCVCVYKLIIIIVFVAPTARTYTKIDFVLSEKLHTADAT